MPNALAFLGSTILEAKTIALRNTARMGTGTLENVDE
jgi:hypothetical protein